MYMLATHSVLLTTAIILVCHVMLAISAPASARSEEAKISLVIANLNRGTESSNVAETRHKRHALPVFEADDTVVPRHRRHASRVHVGAIRSANSDDLTTNRRRRSAIFYLTASMNFCKNYPLYCRRIEVDQGDIKVKVRLAEE